MQIFRKQLLFVFLLLSKSFFAQIDTEFWFAAPEVTSISGQVPVKLRFLTYGTPATITVSIPANVGFVPITISVPANSIDSINLSSFLASVEPPLLTTTNNNGLKIVATSPISCYYDLLAPGNKEYFTLKGKKGIGTNFYTPFPTFWNNVNSTPKNLSSIEIVATENGTTVVLTPRTNIVGATENQTISIPLNRGQTFSARDTNVLGSTTLSGSIISSNFPIAVTVYYGGAVQPGCIDAMGDQITTAEFIGTDYIISKNAGVNERVYVLSTENSTGIEVTSSTISNTVVNWFETREYILNDPITYIKTTRPVYVIHVSGTGCELSAAQVPNAFCAGTYESVFSRTTSDSLSITVTTRTGFEGNFLMNGNPSLIPASSFQIVPGTLGEFQVAKIYFTTAQVPVGSYNKITNSGDIFGLAFQNGGTTRGSSFGYLSMFASSPFTTASSSETATVCANGSVPLSGIIGGGNITGTWSSTGFGNFQNINSNLTNSYFPSDLDTIVSPIRLILTSTGPCPVKRDTITLTVTPAPIANAFQDQSLCINNAVVTMNGTMQGATSTGIWTSIGSGTFAPSATALNAVYTASSADSIAGSFQLILSSTNNATCLVEKDTMSVTLTPAPIVNAGLPSINVCANNPIVSLNGTVSGSSTTGKWLTNGTGVFIPNNQTLNANYQPGVLDVSSGSIVLYLESTNNGSCIPVRDSIILNFTPNPAVNAGPNSVQCSNISEIDLSGLVSGPTTTGVWSGGTGTFGSATNLTTTYASSAADLAAGFVVFTLTSTNNSTCLAVADLVQVNFIAAPFANFNKTDVCLGSSNLLTDFSLPGFGTLTNWNYSFGDGTFANVDDTSHTYTASGNYSVQLVVTNSNGCIDTVVKTVSVFPTPVADFTYTSSCPNDNIILSFVDNSTSVAGNPLINFYYDFGGQGSISIANPIQLFNGSGNYNVIHIVSTTNGCADTIVKLINIGPKPIAGFSFATNAAEGLGIAYNFIDTSQYASAYLYNFEESNTSILANPSNTYFANGTYTVTQIVTNSIGCIDSTSSQLVINKVTTDLTELIPNAISPNEDGKNDVWKLSFIPLFYPEASVQIFNSWGQELFSSTGYKEPWDGKFSGDLVPDGTYFYIIDLNSGTEKELFKGTLLVFKNEQ